MFLLERNEPPLGDAHCAPKRTEEAFTKSAFNKSTCGNNNKSITGIKVVTV